MPAWFTTTVAALEGPVIPVPVQLYADEAALLVAVKAAVVVIQVSVCVGLMLTVGAVVLMVTLRPAFVLQLLPVLVTTRE